MQIEEQSIPTAEAYWDGFSFQAERLGASKVVAIDPFMWNGQQWVQRMGSGLPNGLSIPKFKTLI